MDVLTTVFIAQLVERLDNFLLFPKDGKQVQKSEYFKKN